MVYNPDLDDTTMIAFAIAVRSHVADLRSCPEWVPPWMQLGRVVIDAGNAVDVVQDLGTSEFHNLARGVAALSHAHGGVRVFGMVFCAKHLPHGEATGFRYACRICAPNDGRLPSIDNGQRPVLSIPTSESDVL